MKVNVTKKGHFAKIKGVLTKLEIGEQEVETKLAESLIKNGYAKEVEKPKAAAKK